jgi:hypothetical protein
MLEYLRKSGQRPEGVIARYVVATMGPMVNAANTTINGTAKLAMLATGLHSGGWKLIEFEGNKRDLHKAITRMVIESAKTPLDRSQIQKAVEMEMHRAEIRGVKFKNSHEKIKVRWLTGIDLKAASQGKVKLGLDELRFQRFTRVLDTDVKLGAVASAMQFWCITKTIADYENAIAADKTENGWRLVGSALGIAGSMMELCSDILERAKKYRVSKAIGVPDYVIQRLRYTGKALGIIGALIAAVWDGIKGYEEYQKNNYRLMALFGASAFFGFTASIMMAFFASNPITWLVVGVFIGITIWLDREKDNTIQSWLENCVFGKRPSPIYDIEPEKELQDYASMMR